MNFEIKLVSILGKYQSGETRYSLWSDDSLFSFNKLAIKMSPLTCLDSRVIEGGTFHLFCSTGSLISSAVTMLPWLLGYTFKK